MTRNLQLTLVALAAACLAPGCATLPGPTGLAGEGDMLGFNRFGGAQAIFDLDGRSAGRQKMTIPSGVKAYTVTVKNSSNQTIASDTGSISTSDPTFTIANLPVGISLNFIISLLDADSNELGQALKNVTLVHGGNSLSAQVYMNILADTTAINDAYSVSASSTGSKLSIRVTLPASRDYLVRASSSTSGCGSGYTFRYGYEKTSHPAAAGTGSSATEKFEFASGAGGTLSIESTVAGSSGANTCSSLGANNVVTITKVSDADFGLN